MVSCNLRPWMSLLLVMTLSGCGGGTAEQSESSSKGIPDSSSNEVFKPRSADSAASSTMPDVGGATPSSESLPGDGTVDRRSVATSSNSSAASEPARATTTRPNAVTSETPTPDVPMKKGPPETIWLEGEDAQRTNVTKHGWYDGVRKDSMSDNEWLSHYDKRKPGLATYEFDAAVKGQYTFWWRGNVLLSSVSYSLNGGEFVEMSFGDKRGEYMISPKPDHRSLAWVKVGAVPLKSGRNGLTLKFHSKLANHGGVDCLALDTAGFVPSGASKPLSAGGTGEAAPDEWFPVVFDDDPFSPASVVDMSFLVEAPAGKYGFLKRAEADLKFEKANRPVKFWGCGANLRRETYTKAQLTQRVKYLRKHGVNMVRQHPLFGELGPLQNGRLNAERTDRFDWWFAELKKHGIYSTWSVFYPLLVGSDDGYPGELFAELERRGNGLRSASGLVNVERQLQDLQLRYLNVVLDHQNPYTGLKYIDDPALAVIETHNEDCIFWHAPLNDLREGKKFPLHSQRLRKRWFEWASAKYKSEAAIRKTWGSLRPGDSFAKGELELMAAFHLGGDGPLYEFKGQARRAGDQIEFLTKLQREFYDRREKELRDLGFKGVTVTTAWRSGGPAADPANLYCDTAADMIDRHNYFGGGAGGHNIALGKVNNGSHLPQPGGGLLGIGLYQVEDRPFCCTEWTQLPPNQWKVEAAPLIAFYGMGLQGWDASYHFLNSRIRVGDGWPNLNSYVTDTPHYIGQFPALAFAIYHRHVEAAPLVAARRLKKEQLFAGTDPLKQDFSGGGHDAKQLQGELATPREALAIGRVTVAFDGGRSSTVDVRKFWNEKDKTIRSATGQLLWDYGRETITVATPKTQGIIGRAGNQSYDLPGVFVAVKTPFVSLLFTPLDNEALVDSKQILITALAQDRQTGSQYNSDGTQLEALGGPPLLLEPVQARIRLKGAPATTINVLDSYGVPTGNTVAVDADGTFHIDGTYRAYYYEVKRSP